MKIGVQLYSLRDFISENGLAAALEAISAAGFDGVELAGNYGMTAAELGSLFGKYGLIPFSAHIAADKIEEELPVVSALGIKHVVVPYERLDDPEVFERVADALPQYVVKLGKTGVRLGYHNHAHEFACGADTVSALADRVAGLTLEPDVFWLAVAGVDACGFINRHHGAIRLVHIKELGKDAGSVNPVTGDGRANLAEVLGLCKSIGAEWAVLEIEKTDMPMAEYLGRCAAFMKKYC